ncbi:hypothetical protein L2E82_06469 [Cichorium intybus]|uniref:Uncharacterized protein n=1 Tax=Cichorium intybus TaxID=13427 RepID=A0ACB9HB70_CICIN|nr:hypothetical protein L2E82_06469 [Cichorium intybus]
MLKVTHSSPIRVDGDIFGHRPPAACWHAFVMEMSEAEISIQAPEPGCCVHRRRFIEDDSSETIQTD